MNITRISIDRLYSTGSYSHVKYSLTAEIREGESPAVALIGMERILEALDPAELTYTTPPAETARKRRNWRDDAALTDDEFQRRHGISYVGTREEYWQRVLEGIEEEEKKREAVVARQAKARKLLEDLGGAANWKDAKLDWEDEF